MQGTLFSEQQKPCFELTSPIFIRIVKGFGGWLRAMNFEKTSQRDMPGMLSEFLCFVESRGASGTNDINSINAITESHIREYLDYLRHRPNFKWPSRGGLSESYIRKHLQVIRKCSRYLAQCGGARDGMFLVDVSSIHIKGKAANIKTILTVNEIEQLYAATIENRDEVMGLRDRAMLALYYGCGLRKNEGICVDASEVMLDKGLLYVRKGKGYRERQVPLSKRAREDLENYLVFGRPQLVNERYPAEQALLLARNGRRFLSPSSRLEVIRRKARIGKTTSLHTLRHSVATHLLSSGMRLEQIKLFLGHQSLESTQIYTHIVNEGK